jgi:hypothetical protein
VWLLPFAAAEILLAGCDTVPTRQFIEIQRQAQASKEQVAQLESQLSDEQKTIRNLQDQVASVRGMDKDVMGQLIVPVKVQLERQSGGYDLDNKPGDDGIVLYVQPVDKDGSVIKVAGSMAVTLLDLTKPTPVVISRYEFDVPTTRSLWYGRLMTNHFTVRCPWPPSGPPDTDEVTARVQFTDLLSGRVLTAQQSFKIKRPPVVTSRPE